MENEFKKIDGRRESIAIVAGFLLIAVVGIVSLYISQSKDLVAKKAPKKDDDLASK